VDKRRTGQVYSGEVEEMSDSSGSSISYVDDLKGSLRNLRMYIFPPNAAEPGGPDRSDLPPQPAHPELDALAKVNEELRERCINIVNRSDDLLALRNEFIEVFGEFGKVLRNTEGTSSALVERSAMLALEAEEHAVLKQRYRTLHEENETHRAENSVLRGEVERYGELVAGREARIESLEAELVTDKESAAALRGALEQERFMVNLTTEKLQGALAEIVGNEVRIESMRAESIALNDRCSTAEFHTKALQDSLAEVQGVARGLREALAESQHKGEGLGLSLGAAEVEIESFQKRVEALDTALSMARIEHEMAQTIWRRQAEENRDEIGALGAQVDAYRSRAEAGDRLLAESRADLAGRIADLRAKERHAEQLEARVAPLVERSEQARKDIAELEAKVGEGEQSRAKLADRAQALVRAMSDKKAKLDSADERIVLLNKRLAEDSAQSAVEIEQLQQKIHALNEQVEKEKSARIVVSGALEAARSRATPPRQASSIREILERADEASNEDRELLIPWSARRATKRLEPALTAPPNGDAEAGPRLELNEAAADTKIGMPKARPLVTKRDRPHRDGRLRS
jgi:chromosome segregation ATPase